MLLLATACWCSIMNNRQFFCFNNLYFRMQITVGKCCKKIFQWQLMADRNYTAYSKVLQFKNCNSMSHTYWPWHWDTTIIYSDILTGFVRRQRDPRFIDQKNKFCLTNYIDSFDSSINYFPINFVKYKVYFQNCENFFKYLKTRFMLELQLFTLSELTAFPFVFYLPVSITYDNLS